MAYSRYGEGGYAAAKAAANKTSSTSSTPTSRTGTAFRAGSTNTTSSSTMSSNTGRNQPAPPIATLTSTQIKNLSTPKTVEKATVAPVNIAPVVNAPVEEVPVAPTPAEGYQNKLGTLEQALTAFLSDASARNEALFNQRQELNKQIQQLNDPQYFQNALAQVMQGYQPLLESRQRQLGEQYDEAGRQLDINQAKRGVYNAGFSADQERAMNVDRANALADALATLQGQAVGDVRNITGQQLQALGQIGSGITADLGARNQMAGLGLEGIGMQGDLATKGYQLPAELGLKERLGESQLKTEGIKQDYLGAQLQAGLEGQQLSNIAASLGISEQQMRNEYLPRFLENELSSQEQQVLGQELANALSTIDINYFKPEELKEIQNAVEAGDLANTYQSIMNANLPEKLKAEIDSLTASAYATRLNAKTNSANAALAREKWNFEKTNPNPQDLLKDMSTFSTILEKNFTTVNDLGDKVLDRAGITNYLTNLAKNPSIDGSPLEGVVEVMLAGYGVVSSGAPSYIATGYDPTNPTGSLLTSGGTSSSGTKPTYSFGGPPNNPLTNILGSPSAAKEAYSDYGLKGLFRQLEGNPIGGS